MCAYWVNKYRSCLPFIYGAKAGKRNVINFCFLNHFRCANEMRDFIGAILAHRAFCLPYRISFPFFRLFFLSLFFSKIRCVHILRQFVCFRCFDWWLHDAARWIKKSRPFSKWNRFVVYVLLSLLNSRQMSDLCRSNSVNTQKSIERQTFPYFWASGSGIQRLFFTVIDKILHWIELFVAINRI